MRVVAGGKQYSGVVRKSDFFTAPHNLEIIMLKENERYVDVGEKVRIISDGHGLSWGTDAYLLAAYIKPARAACELGCGSGVISLLAAAHRKAERITAVELNPRSADRAARAVSDNGFDGVVTVLNRDIRTLTQKDTAGPVDTVFANPPYISHPGLKGKDPEADDARHENHGGIADFCSAASRLLRHRGSFFAVFRPERTADLFAAMRAAGLEPKFARLVFPDALSSPSLILCEARKGGSPGLSFGPPLIFYEEGNRNAPRIMTAETAKIYENCSFGVENG